jgi:hypothetical protein
VELTLPRSYLYRCEREHRNGRLGDIHSLDDRYDHDVEELMA